MKRHSRWWRLALLAVSVSSGVGGSAHLASAADTPERGAPVRPWSSAVPGWTQQQEVTATDGQPNTYFGHSVALSGATALIAAPDWPTGGGLGAVYVFGRVGTTWTQQAEIIDPCPCASQDSFGWSVALANGVALIGAPGKHGGTHGAGAAYVYARVGTTWTRQAVLTATDGAPGAAFGHAVALSADGATALIGASGGYGLHGEAYLFGRVGATWTQQAALIPADHAPYDGFGSAVALDGASALIGAVDKFDYRGVAYIYVLGAGGWAQQAELRASDGSREDEFGNSVALESGTALIGASNKNGGAGAVYAFVNSGARWIQQGELTARDAAPFDNFGNSVALRGTTALIGAANKGGGFGAAYIFGRVGATWTQQAELTPSNPGGNAQFGNAVALNATASTALIGAFYANLTGAAYIFTRSGAG